MRKVILLSTIVISTIVCFSSFCKNLAKGNLIKATNKQHNQLKKEPKQSGLDAFIVPCIKF